MKKMVLAGMVAVAMTGCANMGGLGGGRYYQVVNPINDNVILQSDMTTDRGCRYIASNVEVDLKPFVRCTNQTATTELPWRAVAYNPSMVATFVFDAVSEEFCLLTASNMEKKAAETGSGAKVVMPCTKK